VPEPSLKPGSLVILHLVSPTEKFWGRLEDLTPAGVVLRGINLESFDDWLRQLASGESQGLGPVTMFVPLARVERMFLDEPVGPVESYRQRFWRRVGAAAETHLDLREPAGGGGSLE
jgi:hypothetical protein